MTERRRISDENKEIAKRLFDEMLNAHSLAPVTISTIQTTFPTRSRPDFRPTAKA